MLGRYVRFSLKALRLRHHFEAKLLTILPAICLQHCSQLDDHERQHECARRATMIESKDCAQGEQLRVCDI
jgi:hypothetical protein